MLDWGLITNRPSGFTSQEYVKKKNLTSKRRIILAKLIHSLCYPQTIKEAIFGFIMPWKRLPCWCQKYVTPVFVMSVATIILLFDLRIFFYIFLRSKTTWSVGYQASIKHFWMFWHHRVLSWFLATLNPKKLHFCLT